MKIPILMLFVVTLTMPSCMKKWTCECETRTLDTTAGKYDINITYSEFTVYGVKNHAHKQCDAKTEVFNTTTQEGRLCGVR